MLYERLAGGGELKVKSAFERLKTMWNIMIYKTNL
jgi:hypothetical protein